VAQVSIVWAVLIGYRYEKAGLMANKNYKETVFPHRIITYAKLWERVAALLIDGLIVLLVTLVISSFFHLPYLLIFAAWLYESTQVSGIHQATIGQRVMGIKVSNTRGGQLDFAAASLRHFCKYISLFTALSGYLVTLLDKRRQSLHDKITQAVVVTAESFQAAID